MNPCGRIVDCLRSCYEVDVAFWRDTPTRTARIRWYFVPKEKEFVPFAHPFGARPWDQRDEEPETLLGERQTGRVWQNGRRGFFAGQVGLCGSKDQWENGLSGPDAPISFWPGTFVPRCCPRASPDPFALNPVQPDCCGCCVCQVVV